MIRKVLGLAVALLVWADAAGAAEAPKDILNVSYDVSRELFEQLNPLFVKEWQEKTGQAIQVKQSHGGSSSQARAVLEGLAADVVTFNQFTDVQTLYDKGKLIGADWQTRFPHNSSPFYSLPAFLVRAGNPWQIKDWDDLTKPGIEVIIPNPKTSGNARYTYLAAYDFALKKYGDKDKALSFVKTLFAHVPVFDTGGRAATTTFAERGIGDVLITFEAEAYGIRQQKGSTNFSVVTPPHSLFAEFPVAVVDHVVDRRGSRDIASAYLTFLYTPEAQAIEARNFYRVRDASVAKTYAAQFQPVELDTIEKDFGGWGQVAKEHFAEGGLLDQAFTRK